MQKIIFYALFWIPVKIAAKIVVLLFGANSVSGAIMFWPFLIGIFCFYVILIAVIALKLWRYFRPSKIQVSQKNEITSQVRGVIQGYNDSNSISKP